MMWAFVVRVVVGVTGLNVDLDRGVVGLDIITNVSRRVEVVLAEWDGSDQQ